VRHVEIAPTFEAWQAAARALLQAHVPPADVAWSDARSDAAPAPALPLGEETTPSAARVPRQFLDLAREAAGHRDAGRWGVLYEVLWRLVHERRDLLQARTDPAVRRLFALADRARLEAQRAAAEAIPEGGAAPFVPVNAGLAALRDAAARCAGCELHRHATQTVFGQGPADARIMLVGEQPGDQEDLTGRPFVGPAGEVLDRALAEAGLAREALYVTNAVKHFKFVARGKRRIHQTPRPAEIAACRPWLEAQLAAIKPETVVCLGATAARALLGPEFRLMREHGRIVATRWAPRTLATLHPSAVLRGEDEVAQARLYRMLVEDLRLIS
jgi:uracil-DNA glycosylase